MYGSLHKSYSSRSCQGSARQNRIKIQQYLVCLCQHTSGRRTKNFRQLNITNNVLTVKDYQKGQQAEYWISRVKNIIKGKVSLTKACKKREPQDVQQLLKEHSKLSINAGNILCRTNGEVCQTILPRMCKEAVYKELPMNLIHLGVDRTLQLIKDRFYWSRMEEDIRYFISNICSCVRQKKPNIQATAPLVPISSSSPLEIIGI